MNLSNNDSFNSMRREAALEELNSLGYFQGVRWIQETDSTNRQLSDEIRSGQVVAPALLVADRQSGGKGRGGNQWFSPPGCLMFSMAIPFQRMQIATGSPNLLPLEVGLAVAQCLSHFTRYRPQVKWPNDVYVQDKKVCGVLIEVVQAPTRSEEERASPPCFYLSPDSESDSICDGLGNENLGHGPVAIIGIGINCQVDFSEAEDEVQRKATSVHLMSNKTARDCCPEDVLIQFLQTWTLLFEHKLEDPEWIFKQWKDWSFLEGKWVQIDSGVTSTVNGLGNPAHATKAAHSAVGTVEGLCLGIDSQGSLLVATSSGSVIPIIAGTVVQFRDA